jgi:hypothetical protein
MDPGEYGEADAGDADEYGEYDLEGDASAMSSLCLGYWLLSLAPCRSCSIARLMLLASCSC